MTDEVIHWYEKELELDTESHLRLFVRYGDGGHIPGFSLGIKLDKPNEVFSERTAGNTTYFVENKDAWYFENKDLYISLNKKINEPKFDIY